MNQYFKIEKRLHGHFQLNENDECRAIYTYTPRKGPGFSESNHLIYNFKFGVGTDKNGAIEEVCKLIYSLNKWDIIKQFTWIPIPPSKSKDDPMYDDRLIKVLEGLKKHFPNFDYREVFINKKSRDPAHEAEKRPESLDHMNNWGVNRNLLHDLTDYVIIFDDLITTGASFKAAQTLLQKIDSTINVVGLFIARSESTVNDN